MAYDNNWYERKMTFRELADAHCAWADETFGKRPFQVDLEKLIHEAKEAQDDGNLEEFADCLLCLCSGLKSAGFSIDLLLSAAQRKLEKNKKRKWIKNPDGTFSHVK